MQNVTENQSVNINENCQELPLFPSFSDLKKLKCQKFNILTKREGDVNTLVMRLHTAVDHQSWPSNGKLMEVSKINLFKQGFYTTWKTWRTWKSQGILYLTEKSGKSQGIIAFYPKFWKSQGIWKILRLEAILMPTLKPNFWVSCHIWAH